MLDTSRQFVPINQVLLAELAVAGMDVAHRVTATTPVSAAACVPDAR